MPRMDGTGPYGRGQMTGRGYGPCCGRALYPRRYLSKDEEKEILKESLKDVEAEKKDIEERLKQLEG